MQKFGIILFTGVFVLICSVPVFAGSNAVNVSIGSNGAGDVSPSVGTVRQLLGHAVGSGVVDNLIVRSPQSGGPIPIEGGLDVCAESGVTDSVQDLDAPPLPGAGNEFDLLIKQLRSIRPESGVFLNIRPAVSCDDDPIVCAQDVKECPDGSFVGRQSPSCNFAACPEVATGQ
jgi:hypothetical protein